MSKEGCDWNGRFNILMHHLAQCSLIPVTCPNGCIDSDTHKKRILHRSDIELHLSNLCPFRKIDCDYCNGSISANELNNHMESCDEFPIACPKGCYEDDLELVIRRVKRKLIHAHLEKQCPKKEIQCPFSTHGCKIKPTRNELQHHMEVAYVDHLKYTNAVVIKREIEIQHLTESSENKDIQIAKLSKQINRYEKLMQTMSERLDELELTKKLSDVSNCSAPSNNQQFSDMTKILSDKDRDIRDRQTSDLTKKLEEDNKMISEKMIELEGTAVRHRQLFYKFSEQVLTPYVILEINNISKCIEDKAKISSSTFYYQFYKFSLDVKFNFQSNNHLAVLCYIHRGEYDNNISWAFSGEYHFTLFSQNQKEAINFNKFVKTSTTLENIKLYYDKPQNVTNGGWGTLSFISLIDLVKPAYCINDTIKLKLRVESQHSTN